MGQRQGGDKPLGGWAILWGLVRGYRGGMGWLALTSFAGALLEAGFLILVTGIVLSLAAGRTTVGPFLGLSLPISGALLMAAFAVVIRLALNLSVVHIAAALSALVRTDQRRRLANGYLRASWEIQQSEARGRLQELLTSFVGRVNVAISSLTQAVTAALSLVAFLSAGLVIDGGATLAVLGALLVLGLVLAPLRSRVRRWAATQASGDLEFATSISELGSLGEEMQTMGVRDAFARRLDVVIARATENMRRVQVSTGALSPFYTSLAYTAVLGGIGLLSMIQVTNLAAVGAVMLLMLRSLNYGQQLSTVAGTVASSMPSLEALNQTLNRYEANPAPDGDLVPSRVTPLSFDRVSFGYTPDRTTLAEVSVTLRSGEMVGVIGPSGAGKSTLAQLLLGLREPTAGQLTVDGVELRGVDRGWWTKRVSYVPQDALLFTGTVAENIRFFREGLDDQALVSAATQANVLSDIQALPQQFDTHLGERGSQLSGGQRQRLTIARALVGRPELLILDEPTSALDGKSEALIRQTLGALHGNVTVVLIAHRMSTLDLCDRIMVIENGRVTAFDQPQTLRETSAFYRDALMVAGLT